MFTYTIYDANPHMAGPCAWPHREDVEADADNLAEALAEALEVAEIEGEASGEYEPGHVLHVFVWDQVGIVTEGTYTITGETA